MILAAISIINTIIFQILAFATIKIYGIATYEFAAAQFVTFCWAGMLLFAEYFIKDEGGQNESHH